MKKNLLFDERFYQEKYPEVRLSNMRPWEHYCRIGVKQGKWPNPHFDPTWYLEQYPDVIDNPLDHFWAYGLLEGRQPHPEGTHSSFIAVRRNTAPLLYASLQFAQVQNVEARRQPDGGDYYSSINDDPHGELFRSRRPIKLNAGIYHFIVQIDVVKGEISRPAIYINLGGGYSEAVNTVFEGEPLGEGQWYFKVSSPNKIRSVRLDPSTSAVDFAISDIFVVNDRLYERAKTIKSPVSMWNFLDRKTIAALLRFKRSFASRSIGFGDAKKYAEEYNSRLYASDDGRHYNDYAGMATDPLGDVEKNVKTISFYLPQMHPIPENDAWWGKGFTEWTNVSKAVPRFVGHYQPRLPGELGYYDLRAPETMERQVQLAQAYGLYAFCFYYYWFDGKRLLERPLDLFLSRPDLKLNFCICWANENWTRRWDGLENDVLIAQKYSDSDAEAIALDWLKYFCDERYVTVNGRPLILIYRPDLIPDFEAYSLKWREIAKSAGFDGLHILGVSAFRNTGGMLKGLDGLYEFPPHNILIPQIDHQLHWLDPMRKAHAYSYADAVNFVEKLNLDYRYEDFKTHPGVLVGWDTEARRPGRGDVMVGARPALFRRWLRSAFQRAMRNPDNDSRLVFINAWNEWAEGAYLEPDRRHGYGFLAALRSVVREFGIKSDVLEEKCAAHNAASSPAKQKAVICHIFYFDLLQEFGAIFDRLRQARDIDIILTVPNLWTLEQVNEAIDQIKPRKIFATDNVGRDVYPFLFASRRVLDDGYKYVCKIHSKKSTHRVDGNAWRTNLLTGLLSQEALDFLDEAFFDGRKKSPGIAAPHSAFLSLSVNKYVAGNIAELNRLKSEFELDDFRSGEFIAGTMFWLDFQLFRDVFERLWTPEDFGDDLGQVDGTLAHAFERFFALYAKSKNRPAIKIPQSKVEFDVNRTIEEGA